MYRLWERELEGWSRGAATAAAIVAATAAATAAASSSPRQRRLPCQGITKSGQGLGQKRPADAAGQGEGVRR